MSPVSRIRNWCYIAYLFNERDIISTLCPVLATGTVLVGIPHAARFLDAFIWLELHLIAFEIKNQIVGLEEDRISKPYRPIASGRISVGVAQKIYITLILVSLADSARFGLIQCSLFHLFSIIAYNELELAKYAALKSFIGALGYVAYCWGVTIIFNNGQGLSDASKLAIILSGAIFTTTGHAQDFRDRDGDAAIGRQTLAIILPQSFARWSLLGLVYAWTGFLLYIWSPPMIFCCLFIILAGITTVKFVIDYSQEADKNSYWWYNVWLIGAHMLPLFKRLNI
ncbi:hypothetical protein K435DRAFT_934975 [Dendrothele bispora CBS 962.96]|uniref:UbiA prenyltransferase n=1 Tax=Dendrothele bispora (strain CBS 962.96) TaxID=1314807 RepID=A0A4S8MCV7_DENBC|nr:hypothetical protein K435DRAFT_934975 [Dendrothele bispora CBS 962.96]